MLAKFSSHKKENTQWSWFTQSVCTIRMRHSLNALPSSTPRLHLGIFCPRKEGARRTQSQRHQDDCQTIWVQNTACRLQLLIGIGSYTQQKGSKRMDGHGATHITLQRGPALPTLMLAGIPYRAGEGSVIELRRSIAHRCLIQRLASFIWNVSWLA